MQEVIKVEHLSKSYGSLLALDNISLSVQQNKIFGLLGANGAGKSTAIECILGTKQVPYLSLAVIPEKTGAACSRRSGFSFSSVIISQKSKYQNCARKQPAFIRDLLIGNNSVHSLASGIN